LVGILRATGIIAATVAQGGRQVPLIEANGAQRYLTH
jgi:hypothetical protein